MFAHGIIEPFPCLNLYEQLKRWKAQNDYLEICYDFGGMFQKRGSIDLRIVIRDQISIVSINSMKQRTILLLGKIEDENYTQELGHIYHLIHCRARHIVIFIVKLQSLAI